MGGIDITFILVLASTFFAVGGVGYVLMGGGQSPVKKQRVDDTVGRVRLRGKRQASAIDANAQRRRQVQETLKDLEAKQRRARKNNLTIKAQLQQAGLSINERAFWMITLGTGVVGACYLLVMAGQAPLIAGGAGGGAGLGLPRWVLGFLRGRRMKKFTNEFANALDVIVRGVKSGLPLNECLKIIAKESPDPVGTEFQHLVEALAMGVGVEEALEKMYSRMPLADLNFFNIVISIQSKTGGNLAEALTNLSGVIRSRKMLYQKIEALSGEAKASAMIIGSLPPGVAALVNATTPSYMEEMFTDPTGKMMLVGGGVWMLCGILIMRRMINFKV